MEAYGVVLAGGAGRRMGRGKATVPFLGAPLIERPLAALRQVTTRQAVVAKARTELPPLVGTTTWIEPDRPLHPLTGILHALEAAAGAPVLCVAVDLPLLDARTLGLLLAAARPGHACVAARAGGRPQPLCALWDPSAACRLRALGPGVTMREVLVAAGAQLVDLPDAGPLANANTAQELQRLESLARARARA